MVYETADQNNFTIVTGSKLEDLIEDYLEPEENTLCCLKPCQSRKSVWQKLAHPVTYLFISSVISLVQGLFFTYSNATLSTIEKQFGLPSRLSGFTTTGNDVLLLILAIPVSFYASRGHRPRWLAFGMLLSVLGCLVAAAPHFIFSSSVVFGVNSIDVEGSVDQNNNLCNFNATQNENKICLESEKSNFFWSKIVVLFFLIAQMMAGVASLLYYTIGQSYLDDSVDKATVPFFLAISGAMRLLGPVCGYSLASATLSVWRDPFQVPPSNITLSHPQWIGAWWIGYLVIGAVLLAITWALFLLPKTLPSSRQRTKTELIEASLLGHEHFLSHVNSMRLNKARKWRDLVPSLRRLTTNSVYTLVVFKQVLQWFAFFGYITFKSKYIEHQFRLSASEANRSIALISLLGSLAGWLGTGASISYFKPKPKTMIYYMAFLSLVSSLCHFGQAMITCSFAPVDGIEEVTTNEHYNSIPSLPNSIRNVCVRDCGCVHQQFGPVCLNETSTTFYNKCFARCSLSQEKMKKHEGEISSLNLEPPPRVDQKHPYDLDEDDFLIDERITSGYCPSVCHSFTYYLAISVISKMANTASRVPANILYLRSPEERDKDVGLGLFNALYALGSSIPSPILFGFAIDSVCILTGSSCQTSKLCWIFDKDYFRFIIHGIPAGILALCVFLDLCLLKYKDSMNLYSTVVVATKIGKHIKSKNNKEKEEEEEEEGEEEEEKEEEEEEEKEEEEEEVEEGEGEEVTRL